MMPSPTTMALLVPWVAVAITHPFHVAVVGMTFGIAAVATMLTVRRISRRS